MGFDATDDTAQGLGPTARAARGLLFEAMDEAAAEHRAALGKLSRISEFAVVYRAECSDSPHLTPEGLPEVVRERLIS